MIYNHTHTHTQWHTTVGRTPLDEWSAQRRDLYLTTHNNYNRQTSMSPAGFETVILEKERPQTHALDRAATGIVLFECRSQCISLAVIDVRPTLHEALKILSFSCEVLSVTKLLLSYFNKDKNYIGSHWLVLYHGLISLDMHSTT